MAVGTGNLHAGRVLEMNRFLVFLVRIISHFMARQTEFHGVGHFQYGVEAAPEYNTDSYADYEQHQCRQGTDAPPQPFKPSLFLRHFIWTILKNFA